MSRPLSRLLTDLGERSTYDAASQCSRCGYCEQACPTYVATGREAKSARGRNQIVRLMLEGKLKDPAAAREALSTCLLCGACSSACYARVPTADIVLEGRRAIQERPSALVRRLSGLLVGSPERLALLLKAAYLAKSAGLSRLARPLLRLVGLDSLAEADAHVDRAPAEFLGEMLRRRPRPTAPAWLQFAPCGPNYLYPEVGSATARAVDGLLGEGSPLEGGCCGLLSYNYGNIDDSRTLAKRLIESAEAAGSRGPIVGDCSSCVAFLKSYPQLFLGDAPWRPRAERFAERVRDAVEVYGENVDRLPGAIISGTAVYHDSCRARHGQGIVDAPRMVLRRLFGGAFRELEEADVCCGGAGAFSFVHPELSDEILRRKIGRIAGAQAAVVATSSTSCLLQLAHGLRKYYPECRVAHLSEVVAGALERQWAGDKS